MVQRNVWLEGWLGSPDTFVDLKKIHLGGDKDEVATLDRVMAIIGGRQEPALKDHLSAGFDEKRAVSWLGVANKMCGRVRSC